MSIADEVKGSEHYELEIYVGETVGEGDGKLPMIALSKENVRKVEFVVRLDSGYRRTFDRRCRPKKKGSKNPCRDAVGLSQEYKRLTDVFDAKDFSYAGSAAWWFEQIKPYRGEADIGKIKLLIGGAVAAIDRENNTHLNSTTVKRNWQTNIGVGREILTGRIIQFSNESGGLTKALEEDQLGAGGLLRELQKKIGEGENDCNYVSGVAGPVRQGDFSRPRANISFASKFCHYACYFLFDEDEMRDKYSIYDDAVAKVLPYYLRKFGIKVNGRRDWPNDYFTNKDGKGDEVNYAEYHECIGKVLESAGTGISRNGFDHLLWYYYKGRDL